MDALEAMRLGFRDELRKIAGIDLSGVATETILNYPQPQAMPSDAYGKAQSILAKAAQFSSFSPQEKTASQRPDMLPQLRRLTRRKDQDPPPNKLDRAVSYGGHILAGTGAAKFTGDTVETGLSALHTKRTRAGKPGFGFMNEKWTEGKLPARHKAAILATGATLGLAHKLRKEHRRKKWQTGTLKETP